MKQADVAPFTEALTDMISVLSHGKHAPDAGAVRVWFRTLQPYTLAQVLAGFDAHMRSPTTGRTLPIPSDIVAQIVGAAERDGRPDPDEAWAIVAPAADERATVVWSEEMAEAWGIALPLVIAGDMVAARKSFQAAYSRLVAAFRAQGKGLVWVAALGHDTAAQADAIRVAAQQGRIADGPAADVLGLAALPAPSEAVALLAAPDTRDESGPSPAKLAAIAALHALRDHIAGAEDRAGMVDDSERRAMAEKKRIAALAVAEFEGRA